MKRKLRPDYTSHIFICKADAHIDCKEWTLYKSGPWAHDFAKRKNYSNRNLVERLAKKEWPRIEYFTKPKHPGEVGWEQEYAVFKKSTEKSFTLVEFALELMDCGFCKIVIRDIIHYLKLHYRLDKTVFVINKKSVFDAFNQTDSWHSLDFWFKHCNSCKTVEIIL